MAIDTIDGITSEPSINFVGKDGFYWWVGEVEAHEDAMKLGWVMFRVLDIIPTYEVVLQQIFLLSIFLGLL